MERQQHSKDAGESRTTYKEGEQKAALPQKRERKPPKGGGGKARRRTPSKTLWKEHLKEHLKGLSRNWLLKVFKETTVAGVRVPFKSFLHVLLKVFKGSEPLTGTFHGHVHQKHNDYHSFSRTNFEIYFYKNIYENIWGQKICLLSVFKETSAADVHVPSRVSWMYF